jgi:hypothetical protein
MSKDGLKQFSVQQAAQEGFLEGAFLQVDSALYVRGDDYVTVSIAGAVARVSLQNAKCLVHFPVGPRERVEP